MRPYFNRSGEIVTSSFVEAKFLDLKNQCFKDQLPIKIDKFVIQHLNFLDTKIMLASNKKDIPTINDVLLQCTEQIQNTSREDNSVMEVNATDLTSDIYTRNQKSEIYVNKNHEISAKFF